MLLLSIRVLLSDLGTSPDVWLPAVTHTYDDPAFINAANAQASASATGSINANGHTNKIAPSFLSMSPAAMTSNRPQLSSSSPSPRSAAHMNVNVAGVSSKSANTNAMRSRIVSPYQTDDWQTVRCTVMISLVSSVSTNVA